MRAVAVVTGAGSGIGAAIATRLATRHDLVLTHLQHDRDLDEVLTHCHAHGASSSVVTGDLSIPAVRAQLSNQIHAHGSRLRVVVSNAGAYPRIPWSDTTAEVFAAQLDLNLTTHAALAHTVTPLLANAGPAGRFVAISSVLTQVGRVGLAGYIAAKAGLEGLVRALARELGSRGTTVNCVRAGSIEVVAEHAVVPADDHAAMVRRQLARQCIPRRGRPEDVAAAVEFITSLDAGFITGQTLTVDGGWCLH